MILDNNEMNSNILVDILEFVGECVCKVFTSPQELLDALKSEKPNVIFCNVTARNCDARKVCNHPDLDAPLYFLSSLTRCEERRKCYLESGYPYVTGFPTPETLKKQLFAWLTFPLLNNPVYVQNLKGLLKTTDVFYH